ncbi:melanoma antigen recognized by T-cells 1 isoform X2 [Bos taurus]|uniref:melanoma antigen recognized by T-cells 1 isoform X2 n=1 Tax=Bos taurus TaxID=9913 RepID=UPI0028CB31B3|nr:melanoma antigen recognized by T-cells 1 isoform X2 [Bos taurus]
MGLETRGERKLKRLRAREAIFTQTAASRRSWSQAGRAAGIGILIVILGILLLLSCWYCRRRSGYRSLKTVACQAPLSMGFFQGRILEWVVISSSKGSSRLHISCIGRTKTFMLVLKVP